MIVANHFRKVTTEADLVPAGASIDALIRMLGQHLETRTIYVVSLTGALVGIIDVSQLIRLATMESVKTDPFTMLSDLMVETAEDIMQEPVSVTPDDTMQDALQHAVGAGLQDLPVVDADGRVIGELNCFEMLGYIQAERKKRG